MTDYADDIDKAMELLNKGAQTEEPTEEPGTEEVTTPEVKIDLVKAAGDEELTQLIQADDFMLSLAKNQDANFVLLTNATTNGVAATQALGVILKSFGDDLKTMQDKLEVIGGAPQPRRAALTKAEADKALNGRVESPKDVADANPLEGSALTKSDVVRILADGIKDETCTANDVMKAESSLGGGASMRIIELDEFVTTLSPGGQRVIKGLIESRQSQ